MANNTSKESGFSPSQIVLGYAPKPPCFMQIDTDNEHVTKRPRHGCTSHEAREALLSIHKTHVKHREVRTTGQLRLVEKNRIAERPNRKYMSGDRVDFFKNMENPQRTRGVVVEQVMDRQYRQYKVRYGDDQHTKVATQTWSRSLNRSQRYHHRSTRYRPGGCRCMATVR